MLRKTWAFCVAVKAWSRAWGGEALPEPDYIRPEKSAAVRAARWEFAGFLVVWLECSFLRTNSASDVAVEFDYLVAAGKLVKPVYILGDEMEFGDQIGKLG